MAKVDLNLWADLIAFQPPSDLTKYRIHRIDDAHGKLNVDYYSVEISRLPEGFSNGEDYLRYLRLNLNQFTGDLANFEPYDKHDIERWKSNNPTGANIHIDMGKGIKNVEDGAVVVSKFVNNHWVFSTIDTPWGDWEHPVSGNREFGIVKRSDGGFVFYTRAADRPTGHIDDAAEEVVFGEADKLWRKLMANVTDSINHSGGEARVGTTFSKQIDWDDFKDRGAKDSSTPLFKALESTRAYNEQVRELNRTQEELNRLNREREETLRQLRELEEQARRWIQEELERQRRFDEYQRTQQWVDENTREINRRAHEQEMRRITEEQARLERERNEAHQRDEQLRSEQRRVQGELDNQQHRLREQLEWNLRNTQQINDMIREMMRNQQPAQQFPHTIPAPPIL